MSGIRRVLDRPFSSLTKVQKTKRRETQDARNWPTISPGRTLSVGVMRNRGSSAIEGFATHCINCDEKKVYRAEFFGGEDNAYEIAIAHAAAHECNSQRWHACN